MELSDDLAAEFTMLCGHDGFRRAWLAPETVQRGLKVSALVGSILIAINQGDVIISGHLPPIWKLVLTYMVPYCVSTYSTAAFKVALARRGFCVACKEKLSEMTVSQV